MKPSERHAVFALFDDCDSSAERRSSRLYTGFVAEHTALHGSMLHSVCEAVAAETKRGLYTVVLGDYEFGSQLQVGSQATSHSVGALRFLLFERCEKLSCDEVDAWLAQKDGRAAAAPEPSVAGVANLTESVTDDEFTAAIAAIHAALRAGDAYQINYTYRLKFEVFGSPVALYRRLRARQPVRYGALIALPEHAWVLSCSPELFVEKAGACVRARPMKGTISRASEPTDDARLATFLANDPKNRAENLMIVDLLRNDISRIAKTGSVRVPALFTIEPYPSMWAMTSTIEAQLCEDISFAEAVRALFPCGSITGAPKHRAMQLIEAIETTPRGLYTGMIGWLDAPVASSASSVCGDFCLSVAIRTVVLDAPLASTGVHRGVMGVGSGIVLDSVAIDERAECRLKGQFLTDVDPGFQLFETIYASMEEGMRYAERHIARLRASAIALGFLFDEAALRAQLTQCWKRLPPRAPHRVRLALAKNGHMELTAATLEPLVVIDGNDATPVVGVLLAPEEGFAATRANDFLLGHKTTHRAEYDRGWRAAQARGGFDMLFFNEHGHLTEGGRSNVFVKLHGQWWTPPLSVGVLPGVMRRVLLEDAHFHAQERILTRDDVLNAEALIVCNALRGVLGARVIPAR